MIYLMSQITFSYPTQIYYKMNFITSSSILPHNFDINLRWQLLEDFLYKKCIFLNISVKLVLEGFFCGTQKMHFSEYICKTCLKELGILVKCRETFEKFIAAWNSSKNTGLPKKCFKVFWQLYLKNINFLTKTKKCLYAEFYEFKTN